MTAYIFGMSTDVVGRFGIITTFSQPLLDCFTRCGGVITEAATEAENRSALITLDTACHWLRSSDNYFAIGSRTKSQFGMCFDMILENKTKL